MELLPKFFLEVFNATLPATGFGEREDDPIVLSSPQDAVATEHKIIAFLLNMEKKGYSIERQEFIDRGERKIDKITIRLDDESKSQRCYYFDITKSYGH